MLASAIAACHFLICVSGMLLAVRPVTSQRNFIFSQDVSGPPFGVSLWPIGVMPSGNGISSSGKASA